MREHDIERLAPALGAQAATAVDSDRTARAVTARLRAAAERRPSVAASRWLAAAAAVLLIAGGTFLTFGSDGTLGGASRAATASTGLYDLSAGELEVVLDSLAERGAPEGGATLDDLDAEQLRQLLALMEG